MDGSFICSTRVTTESQYKIGVLYHLLIPATEHHVKQRHSDEKLIKAYRIPRLQ